MLFADATTRRFLTRSASLGGGSIVSRIIRSTKAVKLLTEPVRILTVGRY